MIGIDTDVIGASFQSHESGVDNQELIQINDVIRNHPVEVIGKELRASMTAMQKIG
jgi:ketol-acid reductoisomerase